MSSIDEFRGRDILTQQQFEAGGLYSAIPMAKWTWNEVFGGIVKLNMYDTVRKETGFEKVMRLPVLNAFFTVTDYGIVEQSQEISKEVKKESAKKKH